MIEIMSPRELIARTQVVADLLIENRTTKVETIWQAALELICTAFSQDLPDTILQVRICRATP